MKALLTIPLTEEQQNTVKEYIGYACEMAYRIWRWSNLPARFLEDLKQDALSHLCFAVSRYDPTKGHNLKSHIVVEVRGLLSRKVKWYKTRIIAFADFRRESDIGYEFVSADEGTNTAEEDRLNDALSCLTSPQRVVIERRFGFEGGVPLSQDRCAADLGVSVNTVKKREKRAKEALKQFYAVITSNVEDMV